MDWSKLSTFIWYLQKLYTVSIIQPTYDEESLGINILLKFHTGIIVSIEWTLKSVSVYSVVNGDRTWLNSFDIHTHEEMLQFFHPTNMEKIWNNIKKD